jgi:hypothetical protein
MNETAQTTDLRKSATYRSGQRRFSTVQLLIALGLLFLSFPFVEEVKGGNLIVSILFSLVRSAQV